MKITRTVTIDGKDKAEYEQIKAHLEELQAKFPGWTISYDPLLNRATAIKTEDVQTL